MKTHYLGAIAIAGLLATGTVACDGVNPCAGVTEQQGDPCAADPCAADPCAADPCAADPCAAN
ncbi:hypothetical protein [Nodosilinea sp. P-1105]|uniref:hypothetical protein n=1 Tax=Nodosilinea sp. P-1105 TaxID=2546229 RepID=UPI00146ED7AF|nr:hypothetical protein [Nodosilinea sp. P-1105]NMF83973.1 hypothetical protein [Nodosilinea sp. P-1105]